MCFFIGGDIFLSHLDICIMNGKTYSQGQTWYDLVWRMRQSACVMMERLATTDVVRGWYINYEATKVYKCNHAFIHFSTEISLLV